MANIKPFQGIRYTDKAGTLDYNVCPPYDIISPDEQKALYGRSDYNLVRIEFGIRDAADTDDNNVYTRARDTLRKWLEDDVLAVEDRPCLYVYEMSFPLGDGVAKLRGLVAAVQLYDYAEGVVLAHERTLSAAKDDRYALLEATKTNVSPIYALYNGGDDVRQAINDAATQPALSAVRMPGGISHTLWRITDIPTIRSIQAAMSDKKLYIADGHHRYDTALRYHKNTDDEFSGHVMMFLADVNDDALCILPTHRVLTLPLSYDEDGFIGRLRHDFFVEKCLTHEQPVGTVTPAVDGVSFIIYAGQPYYYIATLTNPELMAELLPEMPDCYRNLDVTVLQTAILERYLGVTKQSAAAGILRYTHDIPEAVAMAEEDERQCAFILNATRISDIVTVSEAGQVMPQKSTYFTPKPITGMVMR